MPEIKVVPLGAGQDVGRSCILVTIGGKNIMLDCGMHMGYNDERRFPDFSYITRAGRLTQHLDCVIISHFHLDHCGALPYFSEMVGYDGPIYMTHPTKAICPILLSCRLLYSNCGMSHTTSTMCFLSRSFGTRMMQTLCKQFHRNQIRKRKKTCLHAKHKRQNYTFCHARPAFMKSSLTGLD